MPGSRAKVQQQTVARSSASAAVDVEDQKLWMPSAFSSEERPTACLPGIAEKEYQLRIAQCHDCLEIIRNSEQTLRALFVFRDIESSGQGMVTRAQGTINTQRARSRFAVDKYRRCRRALERLEPDGGWVDELRPLEDKHVTNMTGGSFSIDVFLPLGQGTRELSWVWTNKSATGNDDDTVEGEHSRNAGCIGLLIGSRCTGRMVEKQSSSGALERGGQAA